MSPKPVKGSRLFPLTRVFIWFQEQVWSWLHKGTKVNWGPYNRLTNLFLASKSYIIYLSNYQRQTSLKQITFYKLTNIYLHSLPLICWHCEQTGWRVHPRRSSDKPVEWNIGIRSDNINVYKGHSCSFKRLATASQPSANPP